MNRKLLVGVLISLAVSNVFGTLFAIGLLSLDSSPTNAANMITTLGATTDLTATVSTTISRGTLHHHYTENLSAGLGGCATSGTSC